MDASDDMQYQQDKSAVDARLQFYLKQERDLLHKIAAVEKVCTQMCVFLYVRYSCVCLLLFLCLCLYLISVCICFMYAACIYIYIYIYI
jgi:hypothetical protein